MNAGPDYTAREPINGETEATVPYTEKFPTGASTTLADGPHSIDGGHVISINVTDGIITSRITRGRLLNPNHKLSPELQAKLNESLGRIREFKAAHRFNKTIEPSQEQSAEAETDAQDL
ncbi:MAG TPA: hypothetical protein VLE69_00880 [Candidatus Saccharimonadales bacterium]|nr:hypothetical protein [Candidatus Saccharimonadales bacterium]